MANTWFAFHGYNNNQAINASLFDMTELDALGFHGYPTQAEANAKPNSVPGFPNPLAALAIPAVNAAINDYNNARDISPTVANDQSNPLSPGKAAVNTAKSKLPKVTTNLVFGNTSGLLGRIVKVSLGAILIIAGVMRMSGAKPVSLQAAAAGFFPAPEKKAPEKKAPEKKEGEGEEGGEKAPEEKKKAPAKAKPGAAKKAKPEGASE